MKIGIVKDWWKNEFKQLMILWMITISSLIKKVIVFNLAIQKNLLLKQLPQER